MIVLMNKIIQIGTAAIAFLALAPKALAVDVPFSPPPQAGQLAAMKPENIPQFLVTLLLVVGIVIAVVFLIYGGIKWILSGGDSKQVEGARNHIVAAIIGLIIVVGAFFILTVVFTIITGSPFDIGKLCIPSLVNPTCASPVPTP